MRLTKNSIALSGNCPQSHAITSTNHMIITYRMISSTINKKLTSRKKSKKEKALKWTSVILCFFLSY